MAPLLQSIKSLIARSPNGISISSLTTLAKRTALSPMAIQDIHRRAEDNKNKYKPGDGARSPDAFNKTLFITLFALIFMALVLTAIYFFFFAKNGGFVWKENDWEDYKTTVLRRKGPDGKTLSNATKSTKLGGGSIVPKWADQYSDVSTSTLSEKSHDLEKGHKKSKGRVREHFHDNRDDPVFKDYAHERPAGVGGYNKPDDGSRYAPTNPTTSEVSAPKLSRKERKAQEKREKESKKAAAKAQAKASKPLKPIKESQSEEQNARQSQTYHSQYRPTNPTMRAVSGSVDAPYNRNSRANNNNRSSYTASTTADDDSGTKSYPCHIPGVSKNTSTPTAAKPSAKPSAAPPPAPPAHASRNSFEVGDDSDMHHHHAAPPSMTGTAAAAAAATASMFRGRGEVRPDESVSQIGVQQPRRGYGGGFRRGRGQGAI